MAMTNAEKFDAWRQRHLGKEGDRCRIQTYVKAHLGRQLPDHPTMQDMTIPEAIEHLIENIPNIDWPTASKARLNASTTSSTPASSTTTIAATIAILDDEDDADDNQALITRMQHLWRRLSVIPIPEKDD